MIEPIGKPFRPRSKAHRAWVRTHPCMICRCWPVVAHHLLTAQPKAMGKKSGDQWTVPLCKFHHDMLHDVVGNERQFMEDHDQADYLEFARGLTEESPCAKVKEAA